MHFYRATETNIKLMLLKVSKVLSSTEFHPANAQITYIYNMERETATERRLHGMATCNLNHIYCVVGGS